MSDIYYTGLAAAIAQVDTFTPAIVEIDDIFILTVTGLDGSTASVSYTAAAATVADVTAGLTAAWNVSTNDLMTPVTAADGTTELTLTADVAGVAFSVASSTIDGGGNDTQTLGRVATTVNTGPANWDDGANWSGSAVPGGAGSQDIYVEDAIILYGLDQSGIANTLDSLNILRSQIGTNPAAGRSITYLQIKATAVNIGLNTGSGSNIEIAPINLDTGAIASTINIFNSVSNAAMPSIRIKADSAGTNVIIHAGPGKVGLAYEKGETATIGTLIVVGSSVYCGVGLTVTTVTLSGGATILRSAATTINQSDGSLVTYGAGAVGTANLSGGTYESNSSGTITAVNVTGGLLDFTKSKTVRTVTTLKLDPGGSVSYDIETMTFTNKIAPVSASGRITLSAA